MKPDTLAESALVACILVCFAVLAILLLGIR